MFQLVPVTISTH